MHNNSRLLLQAWAQKLQGNIKQIDVRAPTSIEVLAYRVPFMDAQTCTKVYRPFSGRSLSMAHSPCWNLMQTGCVLQYLINNAGVAKWADLGRLQEEDMLHLFRTNTLGPLMITQEVLREGLLKSGSVVANMTSKVSHLPTLYLQLSQ